MKRDVRIGVSYSKACCSNDQELWYEQLVHFCSGLEMLLGSWLKSYWFKWSSKTRLLSAYRRSSYDCVQWSLCVRWQLWKTLSAEATLCDSTESDVFPDVVGDWDATWRKSLSSGSESRLELGPSNTRLWELSLWPIQLRQELILSDLFVRQSDCLESYSTEIAADEDSWEKRRIIQIEIWDESEDCLIKMISAKWKEFSRTKGS